MLLSYNNLIGVSVTVLMLNIYFVQIGGQGLFGIAGPRSNKPEPIEYINEEAVQQNEGIPSQIYGVYDSGHSKLANALHVCFFSRFIEYLF